MQNNTQLRGIHQGMFTSSQSNKSGGGDGYFPGLTSRGQAITVDNPDAVIEGSGSDGVGVFGQTNDIRGYAASPDDVAISEMNDPDTGDGFLQYAFAELLTGDFIPAGSSEYFINPADATKQYFVAGAGGDEGRFDLSKVSYTALHVGVDQLITEWKETVNTQAIVMGDRAVGNGDTFGQPGSTASSVFTDEGSGDWRGGTVRNDSSTETITTYELKKSGLKYGNLVFVDGDLNNLFAHPDGESVRMVPSPRDLTAEAIASDQGVLYDEDERSRLGGV